MNNSVNDEEETTNEIAIILSKMNRKYLKMLHGNGCSDNCGCSPNLRPPPTPGPNENCMNLDHPYQLFSPYKNMIQS